MGWILKHRIYLAEVNSRRHKMNCLQRDGDKQKKNYKSYPSRGTLENGKVQ